VLAARQCPYAGTEDLGEHGRVGEDDRADQLSEERHPHAGIRQAEQEGVDQQQRNGAQDLHVPAGRRSRPLPDILASASTAPMGRARPPATRATRTVAHRLSSR
jgi:hypothetical protein